MTERSGMLAGQLLPLRLRTGVAPSVAIETLRGLVANAQNVVSAGGNPMTHVLPRYMMWVEDAEAMLVNQFLRHDVEALLLTERHWRIRSFTGSTLRPVPVIDAELRSHAAHLEQVATWLADLERAYHIEDGEVAVVVDTNVLLHFRPITDIVWTDELHARRVLVVVPLAVIDELDSHTYHRDERTRRRAKGALRVIHDTLRHGSTARVELRARTELQVMTQHRAVPRDGNVDAVILEAASLLQSICGDRNTRLVTGDIGMRLRASLIDLTCQVLSDELRLDD